MVAVVFVFGAAWSVYTMFAVENAARATAGQRPYCLQITASKFGYRTVERHLDLLGFNLLVPETNAGGSEDSRWTFHSMLVIQREGGTNLYNWSHFTQAFMPITAEARNLMPIEPVCLPAVDFLDTLR